MHAADVAVQMDRSPPGKWLKTKPDDAASEVEHQAEGAETEHDARPFVATGANTQTNTPTAAKRLMTGQAAVVEHVAAEQPRRDLAGPVGVEPERALRERIGRD